MKEAHGGSLIFRFERRAGFLEELPEARAQFDSSRRLAAAGGKRYSVLLYNGGFAGCNFPVCAG